VRVRSQEAEAVHSLPEHDSGTGVRLDDVHHAPEALGDRHPAPPHRAPGQGVVPEPADEVQEAEREVEADDAVGHVVAGRPPDQGGAAVPGRSLHRLPEPAGRRPRPGDSPVRDVITRRRGSPRVPHDVMPASASFSAAAAAAAAAVVSR